MPGSPNQNNIFFNCTDLCDFRTLFRSNMAPGTNNDKAKPKSTRRNLTFIQPAPPDASPNVRRAASRYITVEPIAITYFVGMGTFLSVLPQFLRYTIALEKNVTLSNPDGANDSSSCVGRNSSNPYYVRIQEVQAEVAYWQMVIGLASSLPSLFVCPLLGAWSDIIGRKPIFVLNLIGFNLYAVSTLLAAYQVLPIWIIVVGSFLSGMINIF